MADEKQEVYEIPEEMLESIAGGVLDDETMHNLQVLVTSMKNAGMTLETILDTFDYLKHSSTAQEMFQFIEDVFNRA